MTTVVVGGGLAGALVARALHRHGEDVMVVDDGSEPGGVAVPIRLDGFHLEPAAGTVLLPHPHLSPLLADLDLDIAAAGPAARRRYVRHRGETVEVRPGPGLLMSPLLTARGKARLAAEPVVGGGSDSEESLEEFMGRRLGREAGRLAAWLMAAGVHAGDPRLLAAEAAFPQLKAMETAHGSLLGAFLAGRKRTRPTTHLVAGGTAAIAGAVAASLGDGWHRSWPVERLEHRGTGWTIHGPDTIEAHRVVAAISPDRLGDILPAVSVGDRWDRAPVAVVWLGVPDGTLPDAVGALVGPDEGFVTLGFLYESSYAPHRAPAGEGLVKALVGGACRPAVVDRPDPELVESVRKELGEVLGTMPEVSMAHVVRHQPGIPQYTTARKRAVAALRAALPPGLEVAGWAYDGVGISSLAAAADSLAVRGGSGSS